MIHLISAATRDYPWAKAYWESVKRHFEPRQFNTKEDWVVGKERPVELSRMMLWMTPGKCGKTAVPPYPSEEFEVPVPENRTKCMQAGEFLQYLIPRGGNDVVIFTDADMVMQRAFTEDELHAFTLLRQGEVLVGPNDKDGDTLLKEAELLNAHKGHNIEWALFDKLLPDWQSRWVFNTGVVIAKLDTWRRLFDMTRAVLPVCETMFDHYAALQFAMSYCIGRWLRACRLSRTIHVHGHFGLPEGCQWNNGNVIVLDPATQQHTMSVFRHCLNLVPAKGEMPPDDQSLLTSATTKAGNEI